MPRDVAAARPFPYRFEPSRLALLCIDLQRDFCLPGGFGETLGNDVSRIAPCLPVAARLQAAFRARGLPVIHTKECHRPDLSDLWPAKRDRGSPALRIGEPGPMGRILVDGEPGSDFVPECAPLPGELVVAKPGKDAFYQTALEAELRARGVTHLALAGCTTEVCVQTTMRAANDRGFECALVEDATESYFPEFKAATLAMVAAQGGIVGWVCRADDLIAAL